MYTRKNLHLGKFTPGKVTHGKIYTLENVQDKNIYVVELMAEEEEEEQSLKLTLRQPWVWSVSAFILLATAYEGRWPVPSLAVSSSHWQCTVSVVIITEFDGIGAGGTEISNQISALAGVWTPNLTIGSPAS